MVSPFRGRDGKTPPPSLQPSVRVRPWQDRRPDEQIAADYDDTSAPRETQDKTDATDGRTEQLIKKHGRLDSLPFSWNK